MIKIFSTLKRRTIFVATYFTMSKGKMITVYYDYNERDILHGHCWTWSRIRAWNGSRPSENSLEDEQPISRVEFVRISWSSMNWEKSWQDILSVFTLLFIPMKKYSYFVHFFIRSFTRIIIQIIKIFCRLIFSFSFFLSFHYRSLNI